jgi:hypothetical protein
METSTRNWAGNFTFVTDFPSLIKEEDCCLAENFHSTCNILENFGNNVPTWTDPGLVKISGSYIGKSFGEIMLESLKPVVVK